MKITAAVLRSPDGLHHLEEVDLAPPGSGEVLVRIVGTGLCHSDLLPRVPGITAGVPFIVGHEGAGIVEELGPGVSDLNVGDHVILSFDHCRQCQNCLSGAPAYCTTFTERNLIGLSTDGTSPVRDSDQQSVHARWFGQSSAATYTVVDSRNAIPVDSDLPLEVLGPLGCGIQTGAGAVFEALKVSAGTSVVVFGTGAVGLSSIMASAVAGATTIIGVDTNPARLEPAKELGATHVFEAGASELTSLITDITDGGAQYSLDTTGVPEVIGTAIEILRSTGTCGLLGIQTGDLSISPSALASGRTVTGIRMGSGVPRVLVPRLLHLYRLGRFPFDRLVTTFPLEEINEAEQAALRGEIVKPVLLTAP